MFWKSERNTNTQKAQAITHLTECYETERYNCAKYSEHQYYRDVLEELLFLDLETKIKNPFSKSKLKVKNKKKKVMHLARLRRKTIPTHENRSDYKIQKYLEILNKFSCRTKFPSAIELTQNESHISPLLKSFT